MTAAERKRLYRRRRIVFFSALAVVLALAVFTVYSLVRGAVSVHGMAGACAEPCRGACRAAEEQGGDVHAR